MSQQPDRPPVVPRLAELDESAQGLAWRRWALLAPVINDGVPLARAAAAGGVPLRTAQRWLSRYQLAGLAGLARTPRADRGVRRTQRELVGLIEGLTLSTPALSVATITRRVAKVAQTRGWTAPGYSTVFEIVTAVDPQLMTLAHEGSEVFRDRYELALRRQADRPNQIWQADHTELDILVLDADGSPARPWLTVVLDDCSRAVPGYPAPVPPSPRRDLVGSQRRRADLAHHAIARVTLPRTNHRRFLVPSREDSTNVRSEGAPVRPAGVDARRGHQGHRMDAQGDV